MTRRAEAGDIWKYDLDSSGRLHYLVLSADYSDPKRKAVYSLHCFEENKQYDNYCMGQAIDGHPHSNCWRFII